MEKITIGEQELDASAVINAVKDAGLVVRTSDEDNSFINSKLDEGFKSKYKEIHDNFDGVVKELTGLEKEGGEKTTDFAKRAIGELNNKYTSTVSEMEKLKEGVVSKDDVAKALQEQLDKSREIISQRDQALEEIQNNMKTEKFNAKLDSMIQSVISDLKPSFKDLDEKLIENSLNNVVNTFKGSITPKEVDGTILFYNAKGELLQSNQDGKPLTINDILKPELEFLVDKQKVVSGLGGQGSGNGGDDNAVSIPAEVTNQMQLMEYLTKELGLDPNTKEFATRWDATVKQHNLPIR